MKISIIVPIYNVEKYLSKCIDSLLNQTLKNIEIILINDGSTDNSLKIARKYQNENANKIIIINKKNGGQGSARNEGLKIARGEYIAYVDSDDWVDNEMFEKMYLKAKQTDSDIVICGTKVINEKTLKITSEEPAKIINYDQNLNMLLGKMAIWNKIYNKKILLIEEQKFRNKKWYEDLDFTAKLIIKDYKVEYINENYYYYLERINSTMNNKDYMRNLEIIDAFDEIIKYSQNIGKFREKYSEIEFLAILHIYISASVRILLMENVSKKNKIKIINQLIEYLKKQFPNYYENKYLKKLPKRKKIIYKLMRLKLYNFIILLMQAKKRMRTK